MQVFLGTEQWVLRRFTLDDVDKLVELDADPEVMRFITGGRATPREEIENGVLFWFLAYYERGDRYGFWAATAANLFRNSIAIFKELGDRQGEAYVLHGLARVSQRIGGELETLRLFHDVLTLRHSLGERNDVIECIEEFAAVLAKRGQADQAVRLFGATASLRASISLAPWVAERHDQEQALASARGSLTKKAFDEAWTAGQRLTLDQATAEALALTQDSAVSPLPAAPFDLTRREQEVLALLSQRLTDPEIAERLFITTKTASNHVANILTKLGATNRREAAAIAAHHALV